MSSDDLAIKVEHLSKVYLLYDQPADRLKQFILPRLQRLAGKPSRNYYREFWALRDISFEVKKGETVGIIGRNGSGKSTLLQLICGTLNPAGGSVQTNGRVAALLELGSGFNPEFTGRENVYMNGAVLGLSTEEIDARFDEIAAFADIGEFIEQPIKTYSSGMVVRLAFSVNVMSQPEIMIVDEALAVGDMKFQAKCMTALKRKQEAGTTVLFVSHDMGSVKSLCSRGIHLENGNLKSMGTASDVAESYMRMMREEMNADLRQFSVVAATLPSNAEKTELPALETPKLMFKESDEFERRVKQFRYGSGGARATAVELLNTNEEPLSSVEFNQEVRIRIHFKSYDEILELAPIYYILDDKKNLILGAGPNTLGKPLLHARKHARYIITFTTTLPLQEGNYSIQIQLNSPVILEESAEFLDVIDDAIVFNMVRRPKGRLWAKVLLPNTYELMEV
jgi:lipopolysaccharide transport system ATP-binding protein